MPELPEVNTFQRYFDGTSLAQKITEVEVHDDKIIRDISGAAFADALRGRRFTSSYRRGKYLFARLDNQHHVLLHFGMTGDLRYYEDPDDRPKHERFAFCFDTGFRLGFDCPRKFAKIRYIDDLDAYIAKLKLGEDALLIGEEAFLSKMEGKKGTIKGFLLDQHNLAGVGNLYADEICYRVGVHPASRVHKLSKELRQQIFHQMKDILHFAVNMEATYRQYPEDWLWHFREEGGPAPDGSGTLSRATIAGRTTYFSPERQVLWD
ncbi:MAG: DNA-formamidopyrimidine glycosylase family protein [Bacteroidota bacterium]